MFSGITGCSLDVRGWSGSDFGPPLVSSPGEVAVRGGYEWQTGSVTNSKNDLIRPASRLLFYVVWPPPPHPLTFLPLLGVCKLFSNFPMWFPMLT